MTTATNGDFGHRVVVLSSGIGRLRMPVADVLLAVLAGEIEVLPDDQSPRPMFWGDVHVLERGHAWSMAPLNGPARLLIVALPAGPERVVAALCTDPAPELHSRLSLAIEAGVELLL